MSEELVVDAADRAGPRPDLGHGGLHDTHGAQITPEQDAMLSALAGIVVDELLALRNRGMKPTDGRRLYTQELPAMPTVPTRRRRGGKGAA